MSATRTLRRQAGRKRRWMRRHKYTRRLRALTGGYFWLPCPLCGEHSGGHEWKARITIPKDTGTPGAEGGRGVCPACELDLGAKAAEMCDRDGHHRIESYGGASVPVRPDPDGVTRLDISIDLTAPTSAYCGACGIDLPLRDSAPTTEGDD